MKKRKPLVALVATIMLMAASCLSSCDNMSYNDAYNIGYGAGTLIRVMSGN